MFRAKRLQTPAAVVNEIQHAFSFSDEQLSIRFDVPLATVNNWRTGVETPSVANMKQMQELLRLNQALVNARSGKYRQA